jgi:hypothetical protein
MPDLIGQLRPKLQGKEVMKMPSSCNESVVFALTKDDVIACAKELDIPEEAITDEVLEQVKEGVEWGLDCWADVVKESLNIALKS